jgi:hypothetical protein
MAISRHSLAALVGVAALSLPACSAPVLAPAGGSLAQEKEPINPAASVKSGAVAEMGGSDGRPEMKARAPAAVQHDGEPAGTDVLATTGGDWLKDDADGFWDQLHGDIDLSKQDYCNFYSVRGLGGLALGIGLAAPLADTHADIAVRDWYQSKARSSAANRAADFLTYAGQLWVVVPVGLEAAALAGEADPDYRTDGGLYEWSNRCLRSIVVGFPPTVALYAVLGSARPDRHDSRWHPFEDIHGVSGHTFMGALPFLTAAAMTDSGLLKVPLILGSFATGWARLNNDRHYLSQVALGWWMACLSVTSVDETQWQRRTWSIGPTWVEDGPGVAVQLQY